MEISDIQLRDPNEIIPQVKITFMNDNAEDVMEIIISREDAQAIAKFCMRELNYGAQLKKQGK